MTVMIELPDEQAAALKAKAAAEGLSLAEWIRRLAEQSPGAARRRRHISEIIRENMSRVPPEIMATMPKMAPASMTITFTAYRSEIREGGFLRIRSTGLR